MLLIIGAGSVAQVAAVASAKAITASKHEPVFSNITVASRTLDKCYRVKDAVLAKTSLEIGIEKVNADDKKAVVALIKKCKATVLLNLALPYQDLVLMDACLEAKIPYIDTANYEHPDEAKFEYKEQWARHESFKKAGLMALLGAGFDPGVTNVFCAYAQQKLFDEIQYIDILDCNAGSHGYAFATNFNPEINLREVSANGRYWEEGQWIETQPLEYMCEWDYPRIGPRDSYLLYHEELESLSKNIKGLKRIRFFMTFSKSYITHMNCLQNVGMLGIAPVNHKGVEIVPMEFLKTLLPDPATLGPRTKGKTNIGTVIHGLKDGKSKSVYIYNVCDHQECYKATGIGAVGYTTGVPAAIAAQLVGSGTWSGEGVFNIEEMNAEPFMKALNEQGLSWHIEENRELAQI